MIFFDFFRNFGFFRFFLYLQIFSIFRFFRFFSNFLGFFFEILDFFGFLSDFLDISHFFPDFLGWTRIVLSEQPLGWWHKNWKIKKIPDEIAVGFKSGGRFGPFRRLWLGHQVDGCHGLRHVGTVHGRGGRRRVRRWGAIIVHWNDLPLFRIPEKKKKKMKLIKISKK